jgi:Flp pilus assembly pilin Flp
MWQMLKKLLQDSSGQDLTEYGMLIGLVTAGTIASVNSIGCKVGVYFSNLNSALP